MLEDGTGVTYVMPAGCRISLVRKQKATPEVRLGLLFHSDSRQAWTSHTATDEQVPATPSFPLIFLYRI